MEKLEAFLHLKAALILAVVFIPLERVHPRRPNQKIFRRAWSTDVAYMLLNGLLCKPALALVLLALAMALDWPAVKALQQMVVRQPYWLQAVEFIVLADLGLYWAHRALHRYPFLWRFHVIHHSTRELDWIAAHRVHALDQTLVSTASMLPYILFGFSEWALATQMLIYRWHSILLHSNIDLGFGPLRWLIASPNFHQWHHCDTPEAYDKNFAGQICLWDYAFGTAYFPRGSRPLEYGVSENVPSGFLGQLIYPFRRHTVGTPVIEPAPSKVTPGI